MKTATVRARISPELKHDVEQIFMHLGFSFSEAIEIYLRQVKLTKGIPFEIRVSNEVTLKTFAETDVGENLNYYEDSEVMFQKLRK